MSVVTNVMILCTIITSVFNLILTSMVYDEMDRWNRLREEMLVLMRDKLNESNISD